MSIAEKLGQSAELAEQIKTKTITFNVGEATITLRVRIPVKREMEAILEAVAKPDPARVEAIYMDMSKQIRESIDAGGEDFLKSVNTEKEMIKVTDNDIILDGTSMRNMANLTAMWETKVESYFHLLRSETDEELNESYEQIASELPEQAIRQFVEEIEAVIRPTYRSAKKN